MWFPEDLEDTPFAMDRLKILVTTMGCSTMQGRHGSQGLGLA